MSIAETGADRTPHDLSHLVFSCGKLGRLMTLSTVPVLPGDSFEQDLTGSLRLSPLRRGLAVDSMVDIFTFYIPHRHIYGDDWVNLIKDGVQSTPITDVDTITRENANTLSALAVNSVIPTSFATTPKWLWQGYKNIWNNYFKVPYLDDNQQTLEQFGDSAESQYGLACAYPKSIWTTPLPPERGEDTYVAPVSDTDASIDLLDLNAQFGALHSEQERQLYMQRYRDVMKLMGGSTYYDADNRPQLKMRSHFWASGYDVDGTSQDTLGQFSGRVLQSFSHKVPRCYVPEHGVMWTVALVRFPVLHEREVPYLIANPTINYETIAGDPAISGNHPPVPFDTSDVFFSDNTFEPLGLLPHSQWYRYHPSTIHAKYQELQGYPFMTSIPSPSVSSLYVDSEQYDEMFQTDQLGHWNMQARNNVNVLRTLPTARDSAMTSN
jgi:hypothetical protein